MRRTISNDLKIQVSRDAPGPNKGEEMLRKKFNNTQKFIVTNDSMEKSNIQRTSQQSQFDFYKPNSHAINLNPEQQYYLNNNFSQLQIPTNAQATQSTEMLSRPPLSSSRNHRYQQLKREVYQQKVNMAPKSVITSPKAILNIDFNPPQRGSNKSLNHTRSTFKFVVKSDSMNSLHLVSTYMNKSSLSEILIDQEHFRDFIKKNNPESSFKAQDLMDPIIDNFRAWNKNIKEKLHHIGNTILNQFMDKNDVLDSELKELQKILRYAEILNDNAFFLNEKWSGVKIRQISHNTFTLYQQAKTLSGCINLKKTMNNAIEVVLENQDLTLSLPSLNSTIDEKITQLEAQCPDQAFFSQFRQRTADFIDIFQKESNECFKSFTNYYKYNESVGGLAKVDLLDAESYDIEQAADSIGSWLPRSQDLIMDLVKVRDMELMQSKIKHRAKSFERRIAELQKILEEKLSNGIAIIMEIIEFRVSKMILGNMKSIDFFANFEIELLKHKEFLEKLCKGEQSEKFNAVIPRLNDEMRKVQVVFEKEILEFDLDFQMNNQNQIYVDTQCQEICDDLSSRLLKFDEAYQQLWVFFGVLRKDLGFQEDLFSDDRDGIKREAQYIQRIKEFSKQIRDNEIASLELFNQPPPPLSSDEGVGIVNEILRKAYNQIKNDYDALHNLRDTNIVNNIIQEIEISNPLLKICIDKDERFPLFLKIVQDSFKNVKKSNIQQKISQMSRIVEFSGDFKDQIKNSFDMFIYQDFKDSFDYKQTVVFIKILTDALDEVAAKQSFPNLSDKARDIEIAIKEFQQLLQELIENYHYANAANEYSDLTFVYQKYTEFIDLFNDSGKIIPKKSMIIQTLEGGVYQYFFKLPSPDRDAVQKAMRDLIMFNEQALQKRFPEILTEYTLQVFPQFKTVMRELKYLHNQINKKIDKYCFQIINNWEEIPINQYENIIQIFDEYFSYLQKNYYVIQNQEGKLLFLDTYQETDNISYLQQKFLNHPTCGFQGIARKSEQEISEKFFQTEVAKAENERIGNFGKIVFSYRQPEKKTIKVNVRFSTPFQNTQYTFIDPNGPEQEVISHKAYGNLMETGDVPLFFSRDINDFITLQATQLFVPIQLKVKAIELIEPQYQQDDQGKQNEPEEFVRIDRTCEMLICTLGDPTICVNNIPIKFRPEEEIQIYSYTNPELVIFKHFVAKKRYNLNDGKHFEQFLGMMPNFFSKSGSVESHMTQLFSKIKRKVEWGCDSWTFQQQNDETLAFEILLNTQMAYQDLKIAKIKQIELEKDSESIDWTEVKSFRFFIYGKFQDHCQSYIFSSEQVAGIQLQKQKDTL